MSLGRFVPWDGLSLGTFRPLGRFVPWDVSSLGTFILGPFCLCTPSENMGTVNKNLSLDRNRNIFGSNFTALLKERFMTI